MVEATRGGADVSLDALGSSLTLNQALGSLRKRGRHVQVGLMVGEPGEAAVAMGKVIANELVLFGSHGIAASAYADVFELIAKKRVPLDRILGPKLRLDDVPAQLEQMGNFKGVGIALVDPSQ